MHRIVIMLSIMSLFTTLGFPNTGISDQWSLEHIDATFVGADGAKAGIDPGPARCADAGLIDDDGIPDLVVGHVFGNAGAMVFYSGNPDIHLSPRRLMWRAEQGLDAPQAFRSEATVFDLPFAPDWISAGDFDGDGERDVAVGAHGLKRLVWMAGDGEGSFGNRQSIALPGTITAWASGEINHKDNLEDLILAVQTAEVAQILVFSSLEGAFTAPYQRLPLAEPATALATGMLDGDHTFDLAVAAGQQVLIFSGGDFRLNDQPQTLGFDAPARALAIGDFSGESYRQLVIAQADGTNTLVDFSSKNMVRREVPLENGHQPTLLSSARFAGDSKHDLLVFGPARSGLGLSTTVEDPKPAAKALSKPVLGVVPIRLNQDSRHDLILLPDGSVTPQLLLTKTQFFIEVTHEDDTDDGTCNGVHCSLREAINYANILGGPTIIHFDSTLRLIKPLSALPGLTQGGSTIDGLVGSPPAEQILRLDGSLYDSPSYVGLRLEGGTTSISNMAIYGFNQDAHEGRGIYINSDGNTITNCLIGIDPTVTVHGNGFGIYASNANDNTIGGTGVLSPNFISSNDNRGITINSFHGPTVGNEILGNEIGTRGAGGSQGYGIDAGDSTSTQIGSTDAPNIISGNTADGIDTSPGSSGIMVQANIIGLDPAGAPLGNGWTGVRLEDCTSCWVIAGNIIAHNGSTDSPGVAVRGPLSTGVLLNNNEIFANAGIGIDLGYDGVTVNDVGDTDTGPNNYQNFPVITSADADTGEVTAILDTDGPQGTTYTIYFFENTSCDPSGHGEGETYLGATATNIPPSGDAQISATLPLTQGNFLTTIAKHSTNHNSSEFSACFEITGSQIFTDGFENGDLSAWDDAVDN